MARPRSPRVRIDNAIFVAHGPDGQEGGRVHGRLILTRAALSFVRGWEEEPADREGLGGVGKQFGAMGMLAEAAVSGLAKQASQRWLDDDIRRARERLTAIRNLPPRTQVAKVPGSFRVEADDIAHAKIGWLGALKVRTTAEGEELTLLVPRDKRAVVESWTTALARRRG